MKILQTANNLRKTLSLLKNEKIIGQVSYIKNKDTVILSNLKVKKEFRNYGYASNLLKEVERINNDIKTFKLCAWEKTHNPFLVNFYNKHGYKEDSIKNRGYYDDGETVFSLVPMTKDKN
jgi:ribosomal protein S18 acetylase RimI-like enzyme